jgi:hypothetical protein
MNATAFENPTGNWSYDGPFQAHIIAGDTNTSKIECYSGVQVNGTIIRVGENKSFTGRVAQGMGAIQMYAGIDQPFFFGYKYLIRVCRPNGQLIWQNRDYEDVVMQQVKKRPRGTGPMFYYDGERIIGQIGSSGPWYQLIPGQEVRFSRHGTFRFTKSFKTLAYLDVTLPRKGWNPVKSEVRIRIPTGKCLFVFRSNYYLERMNSTWLWQGFGYHPGYQPLSESEVNEMLELLQPGPLMEERARKAMATTNSYEIRSQIRELRFAAARSQDMRVKIERIKSKMLT